MLEALSWIESALSVWDVAAGGLCWKPWANLKML